MPRFAADLRREGELSGVGIDGGRGCDSNEAEKAPEGFLVDGMVFCGTFETDHRFDCEEQIEDKQDPIGNVFHG